MTTTPTTRTGTAGASTPSRCEGRDQGGLTMRRLAALLVLVPALGLAVRRVAGRPDGTALTFEVTVARGLLPGPTDGRVLVVLGKKAKPEPRTTIGNVGLDAAPVLGRDARGLAPGIKVVLDEG